MEILLIPRTGLYLSSPVIAASGTFGYGVEYAGRNSLAGLGAIMSKGTTFHPRTGNEPLRLMETPAGMLNSIGLQNIGVDDVIRTKAPQWATWDVPVFVNVSATSIGEYVDVVSRLDGTPGVAGIELNISCPNVKESGTIFASNPVSASQVTAAVRNVTDLPLVVKLSPNLVDIRPIASAVEQAGADAISLINTLLGMAIDIGRRAPALAPVSGGLSGPAIKPHALYMVYDIAQEVTIPIIGMGGIMSARDAIEFLMAGASAVALATALLVDPYAGRAIAQGIDNWFSENGVATLAQVIGAANSGYRGPKEKAGSTVAAGSE